MAITVLDFSGQSYCVEQTLHLMGADGETFLVPLGKKGPVYSAAVTLELTKSKFSLMSGVPSCEWYQVAARNPMERVKNLKTPLSSAELSGRSPWTASRL